jgi:ABC-type phosphate transport system auxiliary subunit
VGRVEMSRGLAIFDLTLKKRSDRFIHKLNFCFAPDSLSSFKGVREGKMEKELKEYLDKNFARLASKEELNDLKGDVRGIEERVIHQFHIITEGLREDVKQVAERVMNVNEKLERVRQELKIEIQETRQEVLAAIKFSYAELDRRITVLESEVNDLKRRVEKIEQRSIS